MFGQEKVYTTSNLEQKNQIEDLLCQHHIVYRIKMKDINQLHPFHTALMGSLLAGDHKPRYAWDFYVSKDDVSVVLTLLKGK